MSGHRRQNIWHCKYTVRIKMWVVGLPMNSIKMFSLKRERERERETEKARALGEDMMIRREKDCYSVVKVFDEL